MSTDQASQSYPAETYNTVVDRCLEECNAVMRMMNSVGAIMAQEERLQGRCLSLENLMHDLINHERIKKTKGELNPRHPKAFEWVIRNRKDVRRFIEKEAMTIDDFLFLYRTRGEELASQGRPVRGHVVSPDGLVAAHSREKSSRIAVASVLAHYPDWPLRMSLAEADRLFSSKWIKGFRDPETKSKSLEVNLYLALVRMRVGLTDKHGRIRTNTEGIMLEFEVGQMAYFSHFFFTHTTLFPFMLAVMINTGWNFEVVAALSDDLDAHIGSDLLDDDYVVIYSDKRRGKSVSPHRSNKRDRLGVYRLLRFVEAQIKPFKDSPHYREGHLWQGIITKNLWGRHGQIISPIGQADFANNSSAFLARHGISMSPGKKRQILESRRLRTTFATKREAQGLRIDEVSTAMNHRDLDTTAIHYGSDWGSAELQNKSIRQIQTQLVEDFQNYKARLVESTTLAQLRESISQVSDGRTRREALAQAATELYIDDPDDVAHLLAPEGQTYIVACTDAKNPTWPGAREFIARGTICRFFNRCPLCDKARIFQEALPYVARRIADLEDLQRRLDPMDWSANYAEETEAWAAILNSWNPPEDVTEARSLAKSDIYQLPLTMRGV